MPLSSEPRRSPPAKQIYIASIILRLALAVGLLSAVADRFGLWGPPGKPMVAWGTFTAFLAYTAQLNPGALAGLYPRLGGLQPSPRPFWELRCLPDTSCASPQLWPQPSQQPSALR
jgi:hypothetical protein